MVEKSLVDKVGIILGGVVIYLFYYFISDFDSVGIRIGGIEFVSWWVIGLCN